MLKRTLAPLAVVAAAALITGLPTLRGTFVGGDDQRLVLNHVLVNHPSIPHAIELFTIVHRDLYQPLPLLSFSGEFLIAGWLGLFDKSVEGGAWLFHFNNVLLYAFNTALVWLLIGRLHGRIAPGASATATIVALLFAIHPFQMETVAWVNGRMMLLSTLFALASLLSFDRWLSDQHRDRKGRGFAVLVPVFALLSAISKVRAGLPLLLAMLPFVRGQRLNRRFWPVWIAAAAVTGLFVWVNIGATAGADLFAEGAEHLRGPRAVRVLLALAFYFEHLLWPACLTSYYPTSPVVAWSDPATLRALVIVLFAVVALAAMCIRWPACRFGALWFFFGIADTLPVFPARNILAADRYMYLPIIGLFWCLAAVAVNGYSAVMARRSPAVRIGFAGGVALVAAALIGTSWHTAKWYNSALLKTQRVVECFPNEPRVWEKLGWTHHQLGHYDKALECAEKEMKQENPAAVSGACQLMGMSHLRLGNKEEALHWLHRAVDLDPSTDIGKYRLALAYEELERLDEAVKYYELAVQAAPGHNPTLLRLAALYARTDRLEHARRTYEKALHNNAYEVPAVIGLVELDIKQDDPASLLTAEKRLLNVLDDLPENTPLRVNLGVVRYARGRVDDAIDIYSTVLSDEPDESTAAINLAQIVLTTDEQRSQRAELGLRQSRADHAVVAAAQVLGSHFEGRFSEAMRQLPPVLRQTAEAAQARTLLLAALQRFDERRPDVASTYALTAELLIADGQSDAAHAFLGLLESTCRESSCQSHILKLRERLFMRGDQGGS